MANWQDMSKKIKNAIISLSDKSEIKLILNTLKKYRVNLISSGGTSKEIRKLGYSSCITNFLCTENIFFNYIQVNNCTRCAELADDRRL